MTRMKGPDCAVMCNLIDTQREREREREMCGCSRETHRLGVEGGRGQNDDTTAAVRCTV